MCPLAEINFVPVALPHTNLRIFISTKIDNGNDRCNSFNIVHDRWRSI